MFITDLCCAMLSPPLFTIDGLGQATKKGYLDYKIAIALPDSSLGSVH